MGLRPLPYRKVARRLADFGFVPVRQKGSHVRFEHQDGRATDVHSMLVKISTVGF